jgi:hypothetical protein
MLKKTIKYHAWDGSEVEEDFYFAVTKAELIEMEMNSGREGFEARMQRLVLEKDSAQIYNVLKSIILDAYGKPTVVDGVKRFVKNDDTKAEFLQTGAFSELIVEMMQDPTQAAAFIEGAFPADMVKAAKKEIDSIKAEIEKQD